MGNGNDTNAYNETDLTLNQTNANNPHQQKDELLNRERDSAYQGLMWLKRYSQLSMHNDINEVAKQGGSDMASICLKIIKDQQNEDNTTIGNESASSESVQVPEAILTEGIKVLHSDSQWRLIRILKQIEPPSESDILELKTYMEEIFSILHFCLCQKHETVSELREIAFTSICDLLQNFGPTLIDPSDISCYDRSSCLEPLIYNSNEDLNYELVNFIKDRALKIQKKKMKNLSTKI